MPVKVTSKMVARAQYERELAEAASEEEGVVCEWVLFTAKHVDFGKALEDTFGGQQGGEEVVCGKVWFVLFADVQKDHGAEELRWKDSITRVRPST